MPALDSSILRLDNVSGDNYELSIATSSPSDIGTYELTLTVAYEAGTATPGIKQITLFII